MPTPIKCAPRATFEQFWSVVGPQTKRPEFAQAVFQEVWRLATKVGYDPLVFGGQWWHETGDGTKPGQSADWVNDGNPAGIGHTDGGKADYLSSTNPLTIARAWITHMAGYIEGPDGGWLKTTIYKSLDPRWKYLGPSTFSKVTNVEDLGSGLWATQDKTLYGGAILKYMQQVTSAKPAPAPQPQPSGNGLTKSDLYVLVDAGHRETGPGGAADSDPEERARTIYLAQDDIKALRAAGYRADLWQEIDGDNNPVDTIGDLSTVASGCAKVIAQSKAKLVIFWSDHYNGPHSVAHVIVADAAGLVPAIGTAPSDDTPKYNTWDVDLAGRVAQQLKAKTGMALYKGRVGVEGLMSEAESGVGLQGWRLALFGATAASRAKAIRFICEHGGYYDDPATEDDFTQTCAAAKVAALDAFVATTLAKG